MSFPKEAVSFVFTKLQLLKTWQADHGSLIRNNSTDKTELELPRICVSELTQSKKSSGKQRTEWVGMKKNLKNLEGKQGEKSILQDICKKKNAPDWTSERQGICASSCKEVRLIPHLGLANT